MLISRISTIASIALLLSACMESSTSSNGDWVERAISRDNTQKFRKALPYTGGFTNSEKVTTDGQHIGNTEDGTKYTYVRMSDREGILASLVNPEGQKYDRYSYNSLFGDWNLQCEENPMTDRMTCNLSYQDDVRLSGASATRLSTLCLRNHDFPGRTASIRIDEGPVVNLGEDGCINSRDLTRQFLGADSVSISFVAWPYDNRINTVLRGFSSKNINEFMSFLSNNL